ncbi:multicopper oxidase family protein [Acetobacter conturbans]|uniref:Multicopper oxidase domain-containing protein n=1 Tax=Acetobacter conturbans TaxID=1737472 RepID=A0ABX0K142_9PROT|nr:multicopper oxidase domain-containing protein [Acetobacter conturbans]NHN88390.1 multicopper oxidase domain-containing protein [Acetobacter conturbans]
MSLRTFLLTVPLLGTALLVSPFASAHAGVLSEETDRDNPSARHRFREPARPAFWLSHLQEAESGCGAGTVRRSGTNVTADLRLAYSRNRIWNPAENRDDPVRLRSYNSCLAAPTIVVSPGDDLRINLRNDLPIDPSADCPKTINTPACFNKQNLHLHGMHVSPEGHADNVMNTVLPNGGVWHYRYAIPSGHAAGTFWYHAHQHGATAIGVASGEAGALIVRGTRRYADRKRNNGIVDIDTVLHDRSGQPIVERIMLFEQIPYGCFSDSTHNTLLQDSTTGVWQCQQGAVGEVENFRSQFISSHTTEDGTVRDAWDLSRRYTLINGQTQPVMSFRAGDVERWRMIAGGVHDTLNVQIVRARTGQGTARLRAPGYADQTNAGMTCDGETVAQYEIAADGLTRPSISRKDVNYLYPGQRSDALVTFRHPGLYCVIDQGGDTLNTIIPYKSRPQGKSPSVIAVVSVSGREDPSPVSRSDDSRISRFLREGSEGLPSFVRARLTQFDLTDFAYFPSGGEPGSDLSNLSVSHRPTAYFAALTMPLASGAVLPPDQPMPDTSINGMIGLVQNELVSVDGVTALPFSMDPTHTYHVQLGDVDEWRIGTRTMGTGTTTGQHVFHIHVNPVEVMDIVDEGTGESIFRENGRCKMKYSLESADGSASSTYSPEFCDQSHVFRDTLFVKPGFATVVRTRYDDFPGDAMLHCHILDHEDQGMMTFVTIGKGDGETGGMSMAGDEADSAAQDHSAM